MLAIYHYFKNAMTKDVLLWFNLLIVTRIDTLQTTGMSTSQKMTTPLDFLHISTEILHIWLHLSLSLMSSHEQQSTVLKETDTL